MTTTPVNIGISHLGQIAINVQDPERATAFYRDVLGLPLLFQAGALSFFNCGGGRTLLSRAPKTEVNYPRPIFFFFLPQTSPAPTKRRGRAACLGKPSLP